MMNDTRERTEVNGLEVSKESMFNHVGRRGGC